MRPSALRSDRLCRRFCICAGIGFLDAEAVETERTPFPWVEFIAEESVKPRAAAASRSPPQHPCSKGRSGLIMKDRKSRSARDVRSFPNRGRTPIPGVLPLHTHM